MDKEFLTKSMDRIESLLSEAEKDLIPLKEYYVGVRNALHAINNARQNSAGVKVIING
jgi:hypothetical protein